MKANQYHFFLFWSRVTGDCKEKSDYDIWVIGDTKLDSMKKMNIEEEFENIPALIDLIDFSQVNEDFKSIAMKDIIWLNKKN